MPDLGRLVEDLDGESQILVFGLDDIDERHVVLLGTAASFLGKPCVAIRLNPPEQPVVILEITVRALIEIATQARAAFPAPIPRPHADEAFLDAFEAEITRPEERDS